MFSTKKRSQSNSKGFSLLELMLTAAIVPIVSFVVFSNFSSGMKLWEAANQPVPDEDLTVFYRKTSNDFLGALKFSDISFTGGADRVSFAAALNTDPELGADRGFGEISIFYDPELKAIVREEKNLSELYQKKQGGKKLLLREVETFSLSFFSEDSEQSPSNWADAWDPKSEHLPQAVRCEFKTKNSDEKHTRTFSIPVGA